MTGESRRLQPKKEEPMAAQPTVLELLSGFSAALMGLVDTLNQKGVISCEDYRSTLLRLWDEMPSEDAGGGAGFLFERLIDLLNDHVPQHKP
jgi:hypothetical protein